MARATVRVRFRIMVNARSSVMFRVCLRDRVRAGGKYSASVSFWLGLWVGLELGLGLGLCLGLGLGLRLGLVLVLGFG